MKISDVSLSCFNAEGSVLSARGIVRALMLIFCAVGLAPVTIAQSQVARSAVDKKASIENPHSLTARKGMELGKGSTLDFTPNGTQPGLQSPLEGNEACSSCHEGSSAGDVTQLPYPTWSGSMMANSARDPLFWAAVDVANRDVPGIGDYCIRCHSPSAWLAGRVRKDGQGGFVEGTNGCQLLGDQDDFDGKGNDYAGIGCHFCHRTMQTGPQGQSPLIFNANIWIDDTLNCTENGQSNGGTCRRGPYRYPDRTALGPAVDPPHGWKQDNSYKSSAYCGSCHDVSSPDTSAGPLKTLVLNDGTATTRAFPLDRTYSEWKASEFASAIFRDGLEINGPGNGETFGETCQSCHMRTSQSNTARACIQTTPGTRKGQLPVHEFAGSNVFMVGVIKALYGENLGRNAAFDRTIGWIRDNLQNRSATIAITTQPLLSGSNTLNTSVRVTNLTGHKLPAGYAEGRRMWINLVARDANGVQIFESGAYDASTAILTEDAQIKIYESIPGVWQRFGNNGVCVTKENGTNRKLFNLALNNCIAKDNRIPPLGFTGGNNVELRPVNYVYPETAPGSGKLVNFDTTAYAIPVPVTAVRPISVQATLKHQVLSKAYADFLRDEAVTGNFPTEDALCNRTSDVGPANKTRGQFMFDAWTNNGKSLPEVMVSATAVSTVSIVDASQ
jgi:hypothetical protein